MVELQDWFHRYNGWSFTKHRLWGQCRRSYYYNYLATALCDPGDLNIVQVKKLKDLTPKSVLRGQLVHHVLERCLEQHRSGREPELDRAHRRYTRRVEFYRKTARETLTECFNGEVPNPDFFDRAEESGVAQITAFYNSIWPQLKGRRYLRHEKFDTCAVGDVRVTVKVDYVSEASDGVVVLSDWKTGRENGDSESNLQMGAYVLWAMEHYGKKPQEITCELIYLGTGNIVEGHAGLAELEEIKEVIRDDFAAMNASAEIEHFDPNPSPRRCLACKFATICPRSMAAEVLGSNSSRVGP